MKKKLVNMALMAYKDGFSMGHYYGIEQGKAEKQEEIMRLTMEIGNLTKENTDLIMRIAELEEACQLTA